MSIDKDKLPFGLAYMGIYLAYNGQEPNMEGVIDGAAQMTEAERKVILSGILKVIEMTGDDIDGDGVVDEIDAEEIFEAAHDQYTIDCSEEVQIYDGTYTKQIVFDLRFHRRMKDLAPDSVKEFMMNFYKEVINASDSGFKLEDIEERQLETIRETLFD